MPAAYSVKIDLSELLAAGPIARAGVFSHLSAAVENVAEAGVERWRAAVGVQRLWEGERRAYQASIRYRMIGAYAAEIESDYKYVEDIESGRPAYDLKRMLQTSPKVRRTKDGRRFLVIPMRNNLAKMSSAAQALAGELSPSRVTDQSERPSGEVTHLSPGKGMRPAASRAQKPFLSNAATKGHYMVGKNHYAWGGKLGRRMMQQAGVSDAERKRLAGTYRFDTSSGRSKSSAFMSFRIMIEGSNGWIIPARPGLWVAKAVSESLQRTAEKDFAAAIQFDLRAA